LHSHHQSLQVSNPCLYIDNKFPPAITDTIGIILCKKERMLYFFAQIGTKKNKIQLKRLSANGQLPPMTAG